MGKPYSQLALDRQICFALYAASRAVTRAYAPLLADVGLTYPQYVALLALWDGADEAVTVGELGTRLHLDTGTLTPLLKRLEARDLVVRRRDGADERRVRLEVTDEGWALRERVAEVPLRLASSMGMTKAEERELRRLLDKVQGALDTGLSRR